MNDDYLNVALREVIDALQLLVSRHLAIGFSVRRPNLQIR
jgi:hypothetical protein